MAQFFSIHSEQPQPRLPIRQAAEIIRSGGLAALPTDSAYALAGHTGDASLLERIRRIRGVGERHHFTLLVRDLRDRHLRAGGQCPVPSAQATTPGPYTFILEGTRSCRAGYCTRNARPSACGCPEHPLISALLVELNEPLLSSTLLLPDEDLPLTDPEEIRDRLGKQLDLVIEAGYCGAEATSVIDLTSGVPELVRAGRGSLGTIRTVCRLRRGGASARMRGFSGIFRSI